MWRFRAAPWQGHLDYLQHICGYLQNYPDATIHFHTKIPNYSELEHVTFEWAYSVYGESKEELPHDIPKLQEANPSIPLVPWKMPTSCMILLLEGPAL